MTEKIVVISKYYRWFSLSRRNCAYSFNYDALKLVLDLLEVKTLIRGHEYYPGGIARNFENDTCYTVHSTTDHQELYDQSSMFEVFRMIIIIIIMVVTMYYHDYCKMRFSKR